VFATTRPPESNAKKLSRRFQTKPTILQPSAGTSYVWGRSGWCLSPTNPPRSNLQGLTGVSSKAPSTCLEAAGIPSNPCRRVNFPQEPSSAVDILIDQDTLSVAHLSAYVPFHCESYGIYNVNDHKLLVEHYTKPTQHVLACCIGRLAKRPHRATQRPFPRGTASTSGSMLESEL